MKTNSLQEKYEQRLNNRKRGTNRSWWSRENGFLLVIPQDEKDYIAVQAIKRKKP